MTPEQIEIERKAFEVETAAIGLRIKRSAESFRGDPVTEYADSDTGYRWAGWLACAEQSQWRDLASAPRDGSLILLGRAESEDSPAVSTPGYWQEGYEDGVDYMGCDSGFVDSNHQVFGGGRSFGSELCRYPADQPTHYMPLPAPPGDGKKT